MIPISAMESASSCKAIGSNSRRGWLGFTDILSSSISLMDDDPEVLLLRWISEHQVLVLMQIFCTAIYLFAISCYNFIG